MVNPPEIKMIVEDRMQEDDETIAVLKEHIRREVLPHKDELIEFWNTVGITKCRKYVYKPSKQTYPKNY